MARGEVDLILERAQNAGVDPRVYGIHLLSRATVLNYIRIADEIKQAMHRGRILDWGCGYGQMSFLLQKRGLGVESYDLGRDEEFAPSLVFPEVTISRGTDPVRLPYPDARFDAALSCGVLEHVADESGSIAEIHRILREGGFFFIYNLPQRGSYKEFLLARLRLGYSHERQYTLTNACKLLEGRGFRILRARRSSMLPQNLSPLPRLRGLYNRIAQPLSFLDRVLSNVPLLNQTAEALELIAVKRDER